MNFVLSLKRLRYQNQCFQPILWYLKCIKVVISIFFGATKLFLYWMIERMQYSFHTINLYKERNTHWHKLWRNFWFLTPLNLIHEQNLLISNLENNWTSPNCFEDGSRFSLVHLVYFFGLAPKPIVGFWQNIGSGQWNSPQLLYLKFFFYLFLLFFRTGEQGRRPIRCWQF